MSQKYTNKIEFNNGISLKGQQPLDDRTVWGSMDDIFIKCTIAEEVNADGEIINVSVDRKNTNNPKGNPLFGKAYVGMQISVIDDDLSTDDKKFIRNLTLINADPYTPGKNMYINGPAADNNGKNYVDEEGQDIEFVDIPKIVVNKDNYLQYFRDDDNEYFTLTENHFKNIFPDEDFSEENDDFNDLKTIINHGGIKKGTSIKDLKEKTITEIILNMLFEVAKPKKVSDREYSINFKNYDSEQEVGADMPTCDNFEVNWNSEKWNWKASDGVTEGNAVEISKIVGDLNHQVYNYNADNLVDILDKLKNGTYEEDENEDSVKVQLEEELENLKACIVKCEKCTENSDDFVKDPVHYGSNSNFCSVVQFEQNTKEVDGDVVLVYPLDSRGKNHDNNKVYLTENTEVSGYDVIRHCIKNEEGEDKIVDLTVNGRYKLYHTAYKEYETVEEAWLNTNNVEANVDYKTFDYKPTNIDSETEIEDVNKVEKLVLNTEPSKKLANVEVVKNKEDKILSTNVFYLQWPAHATDVNKQEAHIFVPKDLKIESVYLANELKCNVYDINLLDCYSDKTYTDVNKFCKEPDKLYCVNLKYGNDFDENGIFYGTHRLYSIPKPDDCAGIFNIKVTLTKAE